MVNVMLLLTVALIGMYRCVESYDFAPSSGCMVLYKNQHAHGASWVKKSNGRWNTWTSAECRDWCASKTHCLAVDFVGQDNSCLEHKQKFTRIPVTSASTGKSQPETVSQYAKECGNRGGYLGGSQKTRILFLDLILTLDASSATGSAGFIKAQQFIIMLLRTYKLGGESLRLKVVYSRGDSIQVFTFDRDSETQTYISQIQGCSYTGVNLNIELIFQRIQSFYLDFKRSGAGRCFFLLGGFNVGNSWELKTKIALYVQTISINFRFYYFAIGSQTSLSFWRDLMDETFIIQLSSFSVTSNWITPWFQQHTYTFTTYGLRRNTKRINLQLVLTLDSSSTTGRDGYYKTFYMILTLLRTHTLGSGNLQLYVCVHRGNQVSVVRFTSASELSASLRMLSTSSNYASASGSSVAFLLPKVQWVVETYISTSQPRAVWLCGGLEVTDLDKKPVNVILYQLEVKLKVYLFYFAMGVRTDTTYWRQVLGVNYVKTDFGVSNSLVDRILITVSQAVNNLSGPTVTQVISSVGAGGSSSSGGSSSGGSSSGGSSWEGSSSGGSSSGGSSSGGSSWGGSSSGGSSSGGSSWEGSSSGGSSSGDFAPSSGCMVLYKNQHAHGASLVKKSNGRWNTWTSAECRDWCASKTDCLAVDFVGQDNSCLEHKQKFTRIPVTSASTGKSQPETVSQYAKECGNREGHLGGTNVGSSSSGGSSSEGSSSGGSSSGGSSWGGSSSGGSSSGGSSSDGSSQGGSSSGGSLSGSTQTIVIQNGRNSLIINGRHITVQFTVSGGKLYVSKNINPEGRCPLGTLAASTQGWCQVTSFQTFKVWTSSLHLDLNFAESMIRAGTSVGSSSGGSSSGGSSSGGSSSGASSSGGSSSSGSSSGGSSSGGSSSGDSSSGGSSSGGSSSEGSSSGGSSSGGSSSSGSSSGGSSSEGSSSGGSSSGGSSSSGSLSGGLSNGGSSSGSSSSGATQTLNIQNGRNTLIINGRQITVQFMVSGGKFYVSKNINPEGRCPLGTMAASTQGWCQVASIQNFISWAVTLHLNLNFDRSVMAMFQSNLGTQNQHTVLSARIVGGVTQVPVAMNIQGAGCMLGTSDVGGGYCAITNMDAFINWARSAGFDIERTNQNGIKTIRISGSVSYSG